MSSSSMTSDSWAVAATQLPPEPIDWLLQNVSFETSVAPALAFLAGLLLTLSPISWPSIPAVMTGSHAGGQSRNRRRPDCGVG